LPANYFAFIFATGGNKDISWRFAYNLFAIAPVPYKKSNRVAAWKKALTRS
jgi:hypothetical protein